MSILELTIVCLTITINVAIVASVIITKSNSKKQNY